MRLAPLRTDGSNVFARHTMTVRVPRILDEAIACQPRETAWTACALAALRDDVLADAKLRVLAAPAPDLDEWATPVAARAGDSWLATDWFFAETYLYRRVVEAVRFWETSVDPFAPTKDAELALPAPWERTHAALARAGDPRDARVHALLGDSLWGNRMDMSYAAAAAHGTTWSADQLLVDDRANALPYLLAADARVHVVLDNAGTELLVDLVLADALLDGGARAVVLHAKAHPTFVSDATLADVHIALARMRARPGDVAALATRLDAAFVAGRLAIVPDAYWNGPRFLDDAPPRIRRALAGATIAIVKGDANYRRLVGDAAWPATTPAHDASGPLPCPVLALRTLKSDTLVGLPPGLAEKLDAVDSAWRIDGKRGVAQSM